MGQTIVQKVLAKKSGQSEVHPGEILYPKFDLSVIHEVPVVEFWEELKAVGVTKLARPEDMLVVSDHEIPINTLKAAERTKKTKELMKELGIKRFIRPGCHGIQHQVTLEQGYVLPGMLITVFDIHCLNMGALGAVSVPVVYEYPTVMATGTIWVKVPETIRINLHGKMQLGVSVRDVIHYVMKEVGAEAADYRMVDFSGPAVKEMSIFERMILCGVIVEIGAKSAIVEPDEKTLAYIKERAKFPYEVVKNDKDAKFERVYDFDISNIEPMVALPPSPDNVAPLTEVIGKKIDSAYIGSCASGTLEELRAAAQVMKNRIVHPDVFCLVVPSTQEVFREAADEGIISTFIKAGCHVIGPTCAPCFGAINQMADGDTRIATSTRNDRGRMGSFNSDIYLASAVTVAAAAVKGSITDPREFLR